MNQQTVHLGANKSNRFERTSLSSIKSPIILIQKTWVVGHHILRI